MRPRPRPRPESARPRQRPRPRPKSCYETETKNYETETETSLQSIQSYVKVKQIIMLSSLLHNWNNKRWIVDDDDDFCSIIFTMTRYEIQNYSHQALNKTQNSQQIIDLRPRDQYMTETSTSWDRGRDQDQLQWDRDQKSGLETWTSLANLYHKLAFLSSVSRRGEG